MRKNLNRKDAKFAKKRNKESFLVLVVFLCVLRAFAVNFFCSWR